MGVDHRRLDIGVASQLLHAADLRAGVAQMGGERVPEAVARSTLGPASPVAGLADLARYGPFVEVVPAPPTGSRVTEIVSAGNTHCQRQRVVHGRTAHRGGS